MKGYANYIIAMIEDFENELEQDLLDRQLIEETKQLHKEVLKEIEN